MAGKRAIHVVPNLPPSVAMIRQGWAHPRPTLTGAYYFDDP